MKEDRGSESGLKRITEISNCVENPDSPLPVRPWAILEQTSMYSDVDAVLGRGLDVADFISWVNDGGCFPRGNDA